MIAGEDESDHEAYPLNFTESVDSDLLLLEPRPLWEKPLADLFRGRDLHRRHADWRGDSSGHLHHQGLELDL